MTSPLAVRVGAQRPQVMHLPPGTVSSAGPEVVELAESVGLVLDDWQRWVLEHALGERADGRWSAFECALLCPRQNGKNAVLEALELAALFLFDVRLVVHSAHQFATASEHFLRIQALIEESDDLRRKVRQVLTANGKEAIVLRSGARLKFIARSRGAARGYTGDLIVLDEAYDLPAKAIGAMIPALSARSLKSSTGVQVWYTSSAPHADSTVLHGIRDRGRAGDVGRLFYAEWGHDVAPEIDDMDAVAAVNPGLGIRIAEEFIDDERTTMCATEDGRVEYLRERLGVPDRPGVVDLVIPLETWRARRDTGSQIVSGRVAAIDVAPDRSRASLALSGINAAGVAHVEVLANDAGTDWVVAAAAAEGVPVVVDPGSAAGSLIGDLQRAGVTVVEISGRQYAQACGSFFDDVVEGKLVHVAQAVLDEALVGARKRDVGDAWAWDRRKATLDITPLVAVTLARWGLDNAPADPEFFVY